MCIFIKKRTKNASLIGYKKIIAENLSHKNKALSDFFHL